MVEIVKEVSPESKQHKVLFKMQPFIRSGEYELIFSMFSEPRKAIPSTVS
jgi:hypothetical protein